MRSQVIFLVILAGLASAAPAGKTRYDHGDPSDLEQYALELINRARREPAREAARHGVALDDGLEPGSLPASPRPPLAFNPDLLAAARDHSSWMLEEKSFSHEGKDGNLAGQRMLNAGYKFLDPYLWGENIGWAGVTGQADPALLVRRIHRNIFRSPGHRWNMLEADHDEAGIGLANGDFSHNAVAYHAWFATANFARSAASPAVDGPFLLGVVYADRNANAQYDPGEGIGGVTIDVEPGGYFAVSSASGGYAVPLGGSSGVVTVTAGGANWPEETRQVELPDAANLKLDVVESFPAPVPAADPVFPQDSVTLLPTD